MKRRGFTKASQAQFDAWLCHSDKALEALSRAGKVSPALYACVQRALGLAYQAGRNSMKELVDLSIEGARKQMIRAEYLQDKLDKSDERKP